MGLSRLKAVLGISVAAVIGGQAFMQGVHATSRDAAAEALKALYKRPAQVPYPKENAYTKAREELGKALFFDPRLSGSQSISCATCHNPSFSWGDGLAKGVGHGHKTLGRRTPTILNAAWSDELFWDGRSPSLEDQALGPIQAAAEMNMNMDLLVERIRGIAGYQPLFEKAYPGEPISKTTIAKAIATFERTVVSGKSPFDKFVEGDEKAISESARRGFVLFNTKARCLNCHSGWNFSDNSFHDIGVPGDDPGRATVVPGAEPLRHAFKTPTLRNVERRGPYMHDGSERTLEDVVDLYDVGGRVKRPSLSKLIVPLKLTQQEKADLVSFLKTLTSNDKAVEMPALPR